MTDLTCDQVQDAATEFALGILPGDEGRGVAAHLMACPACRQQVEAIRDLGDRLLDLVPDAEPPLGFDHRVLSAAVPPRPRRRARLLLAAAAAALVLAAGGAVTATELIGSHHPATPYELIATFRQGARAVGTVYVGGHPAWITMTVDDPTLGGTVSCQLVERDGSITPVGTFALVGGRGSWGAPDPATKSEPAGARLVGPSGAVLAVATFPAG